MANTKKAKYNTAIKEVIVSCSWVINGTAYTIHYIIYSIVCELVELLVVINTIDTSIGLVY
jgi:hypothetical protein